MPRQLSEEMIQAIHKRTAANRTYMHSELKNIYLLRSLLFCDKCGAALTDQTNSYKKKYYRHPKNGCNTFKIIEASKR